ncbi:sensor histidine kinase [Cohnella sp. AR92]|uniref:sensor histidine kinase n=1 Tax=Cohnella sp. AR92 TaxID=648716 RepID=UPI0013154232|nr:sensor histidine kinase [Cohnella sp. AR92]
MAIQSVLELEPYVLFEERNRIAEELHDRIGPHLFGIACAVHSVEREWSTLSEEQKLEQLREIQAAAANASREMRATIYNLSAAEPGGSAWLDSVETLLSSLSRLNGVRIRFRAPESDCRLSVHHRKALYRIIAEAVGNAIRHGASSQVDVKLTVLRSSVTLRISDNGRGFDACERLSAKKDSGFGLRNMKMLATSLGGTMQICSEAGSGARIAIHLPLAGRQEKMG